LWHPLDGISLPRRIDLQVSDGIMDRPEQELAIVGQFGLVVYQCNAVSIVATTTF
jgi:hypothetical protein